MPNEVGTSGYRHPHYAQSLAEFGRPRLLRGSGGWILEREIPGTKARDAMGCYPLFCCRDWSALEDDLAQIKSELVSLVLVTDPFGDYSEALLGRTFPDLAVRFKEHFVSDLRRDTNSFVTRHHQYYARKAVEKVAVERCVDPASMLNEWSALYDHLVARHGLAGIKTFSRASFAQQLNVPGMVMLRATHEGETVGAQLFYLQDGVMFSHLAASSGRGYELMAAYALAWQALKFFAGDADWIDWGAGAGLGTQGSEGLTRFKRGWSSAIRPAYLCGRIFDPVKYDELAQHKRSDITSYFPAYREGELS
jgi:hypothetical protein